MPQTTPEAPIFLAHLTPSPRHSLTPNRHLCTLSFTLLPPPLFPQDLSLASLDERANQTAGALASGVRAVRTVRRIFARAGVEVQMTQESVRELYAYLVLETWASHNPSTHPHFLSHLIPLIISSQALHSDSLTSAKSAQVREVLEYSFDPGNETQLYHCRSGIFSHMYRYLASEVQDAQRHDDAQAKRAVECKEDKGIEHDEDKEKVVEYGFGELIAGIKQGLIDHVRGDDCQDSSSASAKEASNQLCNALQDDPYKVIFDILVDMEGARQGMKARREARAAVAKAAESKQQAPGA